MWNLKQKIWYLFYLVFAANLPVSRRMKVAKHFRAFFARRIVKHLGVDANIERKAFFTPELSLGNHSSIGVCSEIYGKVTIGNDVMMGPEVIVYTTGHKHDLTEIPMREQGFEESREVIIEDDVWIGSRAIIMPGVKIGKGCIIGAGAVVTKDIPSYSVAVGVPARVVKSRLEG